MAEWGVFAVSRGIWGDADFAAEPYTEREAFIWLVSAAAWKEIRLGHGGTVIALQRAEFCFSLRFMAEKWQWKKDRVARFLLRMQNRDIIRDTSRDNIKIYSIKNYNRFQVVGIPNATPNATHVATQPRQHRDKEETLQTSQALESTPSLRSGDAREEPKRASKKAVSRQTQIPDGVPSQADKAAAAKYWLKKGRNDLCAAVDDEADQFRDRCLARGETALDWAAKWRTWYRNALKYSPQTRNNQHRESSHEQTERIARKMAAADSSRNENADFGEDSGARISLPGIRAIVG